MSDPKKKPTESKVEVAKKASRHLRGTIRETLASDATHFDDADLQLIKFHGTYQQDDRDQRRALRDAGAEKAYSFMIRCAIPGGRLTAEQYLALDDLASKYANNTLRITTRQGIQYHGVLKGDLKATIAEINHALVTTLAACGDVERNVMTCSAPLADDAHVALRAVAREIAEALRPASRAYHEIWLGEDKVVTTDEEEPFYKDIYLPRKFKTGIALESDNCIEAHSQDCGLIAIVEGGLVEGFNVLVGGGMGMTHKKEDTFASLGQPLGFVTREHAVETVRTVAAIFRDFGNRADRRHARLKYLLAERGMDWFRGEFQQRVSFDLAPSRDMAAPQLHDHLGAHRQADGKQFYGVFVENGRITDHDGSPMRTALRAIVEKHRPTVTFTAQQSLLLGDLDDDALTDVVASLESHGIPVAESLSAARRYSMACPALPTCGLAMAESERLMPSVVDEFEAELQRLGVGAEPLTLRMTGCPNGCARPYTADIAFVGRKPDVYHVFVGGGLAGDRVADLYAEDVETDSLVPTLRPLLEDWVKNRRDSEGLSDYYQRLRGSAAPRQMITGNEQPTQTLIQLGVPK